MNIARAKKEVVGLLREYRKHGHISNTDLQLKLEIRLEQTSKMFKIRHKQLTNLKKYATLLEDRLAKAPKANEIDY